jgi:hypothetical protein
MAFDGLGKSMTAEEVARELGVGRDTVRANAALFGGVRVGKKKTVFFEKLTVKAMEKMNADQAHEQEGQGRMVWQNPSAEWQEEGEEVPHETRGRSVGGEIPANVHASVESRHGLW